MRLVCPNCSAQYEVDASMIPDEGRDVQCSNCGHTWFELGPAQVGAAAFEAESEPEPESSVEADELEAEAVSERTKSYPRNLSREVFEDDDDDDGAWSTGDTRQKETEAERDAKLSDAVQAIAASSAEDESPDEDEDEIPAAAAPAGTRAVPRRPADAAALDILKEEADRELSKRRAPSSEALETQADLGLSEVRKRDVPSRALRARQAHLGEGADKHEEKPDDGYEAPRRDLLPDIDEINSTLKPAARKAEVPPEVVAKQRSGFRAGFLLMILTVVGLIFLYAQAPAIARALPQAEAPLIKFVDGANALRDRIDSFLAN